MPIRFKECQRCAGTLEVDNEKKIAVCKYCGATFPIEDVIENYISQQNNYSTTNNYGEGTTVNYFEGLSKETMLGNANHSLSIKNYGLAREQFEDISRRFTDEYQGWWGLVRSYTEEFSNYDVAPDIIIPYYQYTMRLCPNPVKPELEKQFKEYLHQYALRESAREARAFAMKKDKYNTLIEDVEEQEKALNNAYNSNVSYYDSNITRCEKGKKQNDDEKRKQEKRLAKKQRKVKAFVVFAVIAFLGLVFIIASVKDNGSNEFLLLLAVIFGIAGFIGIITDAILFFKLIDDSSADSYRSWIANCQNAIARAEREMADAVNSKAELQKEYSQNRKPLCEQKEMLHQNIEMIDAYLHHEEDERAKAVYYDMCQKAEIGEECSCNCCELRSRIINLK